MKTGESRWMDEATLETLLRQAQAGDTAALGELYRNFHRRVLGLCRYLLGSAAAAEDAASEVFLRMQQAMSTYDTTLPFARWLLAIASHYCVDQLRRRRVEQRLFASEEIEGREPETPSVSPLGEALAGEQRAAVRAAVAGLPERLRLPLVLRYYSELSYDQIAAELDLNRNTVATLILRAKKELRRALRRTPTRWVQ